MATARRPLTQRPLLKVLVAIALLVPLAACGTRWNSAQEAEVKARLANGGSSAASSSNQDTPGATSGDTSTDALGTGTGTGTGSGTATGSGTGTGTGTGTGSVGATNSKAPCTAASTEVGVTPTEIRVGSISSLSGPVPGLGGSAAAAARAYVAYRNSIGGVCGRKIVLQEADDGTDNARYRSVISEMSTKTQK